MIISERIFEIMKKQKMSQRELSRRTGITISTISDWNTKKSNPASDKLLVISEALGVSVEELLIGSESLEENFSNVLKLRDNFMNNIKSINNINVHSFISFKDKQNFGRECTCIMFYQDSVESLH